MKSVEFGVYFVPEENSDFYKKGSEIVGYDIRNRRDVCYDVIGCSCVEDRWRASSKKFGLHMTLTDIVTINESQLPKLIRRVANIFHEVIKEHPIGVKCSSIDVIGDRKNVLGINVEKTEHLQYLHESLVEIQKEGRSSHYTRKILTDPKWENTLTEEQKSNMQKYLSPYILKEFVPHFTLFDPISSRNTEKMMEEIERIMNLPFTLTLQRLSIVTKCHDDNYFSIYDEIPNL